ncbi:MAG: helix-turn-helix domain-containing protein [Caldilineaceae bacterium]|nr:helix-turn-helix domain-containing protein [Caldilineaceae bacterium]
MTLPFIVSIRHTFRYRSLAAGQQRKGERRERDEIDYTVRRVCLEYAQRKLRMGAKDITEIALVTRYHTLAAFGKEFKQQFGLSPSEFRQLSCRTATHILMKGRAL